MGGIRLSGGGGRTAGGLRRLAIAATVVDLATWTWLASSVSARYQGLVAATGAALVLLDLPAIAYRSVRVIALVVRVPFLAVACAALVARPEAASALAAVGTCSAVVLLAMSMRRPTRRSQLQVTQCIRCGAPSEGSGR